MQTNLQATLKKPKLSENESEFKTPPKRSHYQSANTTLQKQSLNKSMTSGGFNENVRMSQ